MNDSLEDRIRERTRMLRESEERYALAVQTASIWDLDVQTGALLLSPRLAERLGYGVDAFHALLEPASILPIIHSDDRSAYEYAFAEHLKAPDSQFYHEIRLIKSNGDVRWYRAQEKSIGDLTGAVLRSVGLLSDISDQKSLEKSLLESQRMEAIGQLTGGVAHDFNNLLTVMMGNAELLQLDGTADPDLIDPILAAGARGAKLTQQLLAYSRRQTLQPQDIPFEDLIERMSHMLSRVLGDAIHVEAVVPDGIWPVRADPAQVEAAVLKLAINSRDARPNGGSLTIGCRNANVGPGAEASSAGICAGRYLAISLSYTGSGMSERTQARAFEPFFTTKTVCKGSGLGLSMVYGFAKQSGGGVRIESVEDTGTVVTMYSPRSVGAGGEAASGNVEGPNARDSDQRPFLSPPSKPVQ